MTFTQEVTSPAENEAKKEDKSELKSDGCGEELPIAENSDHKGKANSEKSVNQKKLLKPAKKVTKKTSKAKNTSKTAKPKGKASKPKDEPLKDGKSFDNTNASVQNNENDQNANEIANNAQSNQVEENKPMEDIKDVFMEDELGFGNDDSFDSPNIIQIQHEEKQSDMIKNTPIDNNDEILEKNLGFGLEYSEPMQVISGTNKLNLPGINNLDFEMNQMPDHVGDFSHHSGLLNDDFIDSHQFCD